ncbi:MAG: hypothetical protein LBI49_08380 [Nocardiopsaceae bacterium]|jgi:hypothetical protein|nr:hypothetical protein [Nocardiopsaceae bacterium]
MSPLTGVLGEAWQLYKRYAAHFLIISFIIYVIAAVLVGLLDGFGGAAGRSVSWIISLVATFLVYAALVKAVQDVRDGRVDMDLGQTIKAAVPYLLPVAAASILAAIGIGIGFILLIVPGLILLTFWSLIVPSIMIGEAGIFESFSRSWRTVRGYAWHVFGTYVLVFLIRIAFEIVLSIILFALPILARNLIADVVAGTLFTPFLALVVTLIYYRLNAAHAGQWTPAAAGAGWPGGPGAPPPGGPGGPPGGPGGPPPGGPWSPPPGGPGSPPPGPPGGPGMPPPAPPQPPPGQPPGQPPPGQPPPYRSGPGGDSSTPGPQAGGTAPWQRPEGPPQG